MTALIVVNGGTVVVTNSQCLHSTKCHVVAPVSQGRPLKPPASPPLSLQRSHPAFALYYALQPDAT